MKHLGFGLVVVAALAGTAHAEEFYEGDLWFRPSVAQKEFETVHEACRANAEAMTKQGNVQEFVGTKDGPKDGYATCVLRDMKAKKQPEWDQENNVQKIIKCLDGGTAVSHDKTYTFKSLRCRCDPTHGCPKNHTTGKTEHRCPQRFANNPICKKKQVDSSPRCTQQKATPRVTNVTARQRSAKAMFDTLSTRKGYQDALEYDAVLQKYTKEIASGTSRRKFATFGPQDMCETGGPVDVNIGASCGSRAADFAAANNIAGLGEVPERKTMANLDCVWHHHEEMGRMQLVKKSAHRQIGHTGGVKILEEALGIDEYPLCCP